MSVDPPPAATPPPFPPEGGPRALRHASAPRRADYRPAYTKLVKRLRVALPVAAIAVLCVALLWPKVQEQFNHPSTVTDDERRARMVNSRFVGTDRHGRPYTVTADAVEQAPGGGAIEMIHPIAELTLENGHWTAIKADHGQYDQAAGWMDLTGHVELFHDEGYRFATEHAHIEFARSLVWGDRMVTGQGPRGEIEAHGFRVLNKGDTISFTGPARLRLRGKGALLPTPGSDVVPAQDVGAAPPPPLDIAAGGSIEWQQQDRIYVARGAAEATRGTVTLHGDVLAAFYRQRAPAPGTPAPAASNAAPAGFNPGTTEIWRVVALGNVKVDGGTRHAEGDRLDYDADQRVLVLTGNNLKATAPADTVTARDSLEYWQDLDLGVARGDARVVKADGESLSADTVAAHFVKDEKGDQTLSAIDGSGKLVLVRTEDTLRGDHGTYDLKSGLARAEGSIDITRGESRITGASATMDHNAGIFRVFAGPSERAHGVFVPASASSTAGAHPKKNGGSGSSDGPLDVTAAHELDWLQQDKAYVARGNVMAKRGTVTLTGDPLTAYYRPRTVAGTAPPAQPAAGAPPSTPQSSGAAGQSGGGSVGLDTNNTEIWRVVAGGGAHINSEGRDAWGDVMNYDADKRIVTLTGGNLRATAPGQTVIARDSLEYWQDGGWGVARGNAVVTKANGQSLAGDQILGDFVKDQAGQSSLKTMRAEGHVVVTTATDVVHGDEGTYDLPGHRAVVNRNVRLTRGLSQLEGDSAETNTDTSISQIYPGRTGGKLNPIRGLLVQKKAAAPPPSSPAPSGATR